MIEEWLFVYGYMAILIVTFLEGESIVILAGIAAYQGHMNLALVILCAVFGGFCGDQLYYTIGRRYGTPLLERFPNLKGKTAWAFTLVRKHETAFILTFRFIYGVRNVSPFVIAMSGVPRLKFTALNFIGVVIWAFSFAFGGYYFGQALEHFFGDYQDTMLYILIGAAVAFGASSLVRKLLKRRRDNKSGGEKPRRLTRRADDPEMSS